MGTTHVIRGEEWITSLPIHYELFNTLGFELPYYLHLDSIMKQEMVINVNFQSVKTLKHLFLIWLSLAILKKLL